MALLPQASEAILCLFGRQAFGVAQEPAQLLLMGPVDFLLRVVAPDVESYERFYFEKLSRVPGIQEITALPIPNG